MLKEEGRVSQAVLCCHEGKMGCSHTNLLLITKTLRLHHITDLEQQAKLLALTSRFRKKYNVNVLEQVELLMLTGGGGGGISLVV